MVTLILYLHQSRSRLWTKLYYLSTYSHSSLFLVSSPISQLDILVTWKVKQTNTKGVIKLPFPLQRGHLFICVCIYIGNISSKVLSQ